jgi:hypothetical protein
MNKQPSVAKTLAWVYGAVAAFTATYLIGGILLDRQARKRKG